MTNSYKLCQKEKGRGFPCKLSMGKQPWFIFLLALVIRLAYVGYIFLTDVNRHFTDDVFYRRMALDILDGGRFFYELEAIDPRYDWLGPVLPWINSLTIRVFGSGWLGIFAVTSIASAFISLYIYKTALLVRNSRAAMIAGLFSAVYVYFIMFCAGVGKDIWMTLALVASAYHLLRSFHQKSNKREPAVLIPNSGVNWVHLIIFSAINVLSLHLDERFAILSPLFLLYILFGAGLRNVRCRVRPFLASSLIMLVLMLPWQIRNYMRYDKIVILTKRTEHITDKLLGYDSVSYELDRVMNYYRGLIITPEQIDSVCAGTKLYTDAGTRIPIQQVEAMRRGILPSAFYPLQGIISRLKIMLQPWQFKGEYTCNGYYYYERSLRNNLVSLVFYGLALLLSLPGLLVLYRNNQSSFWLFTLLSAVYLGEHVLLVPFTVWRYRLPLDSLLLVTGAMGCEWSVMKIKGKWIAKKPQA